MSRDNDAFEKRRRALGYELLGPVVHFYLRQLDHHLRQLDNGSTRFLFVSRAGVRIRRLYELFLDGERLSTSKHWSFFWISRLLIAKGIYGRASELSVRSIEEELAPLSLSATVGCLFSAEIQHGGKESDPRWNSLPLMSLGEFLRTRRRVAKELVRYLESQSRLLESYLEKTLRGYDRAVLVDTGWQGTAQSLLTATFSEYEWNGLYFGRILKRTPPAPVLSNMAGLIFENDEFDPAIAESAFTLHRHLIESLFEPNAPSIERLIFEPASHQAIAPEAELVLEDPCDERTDPFYVAVQQYLTDACGEIGQAESLRRYKNAIDKLAKVLTYPTADQARAFEGKPRSADFGRNCKATVLSRPTDDGRNSSPHERIESSLWPQGQIAIEYPPPQARYKQEARLPKTSRDFDPTSGMDIWSTDQRVAIITRTKNRPLLLERAARSVAQQRYSNYEWIVVNDGGEPECVKEIIDSAPVDPRRIIFCNNHQSLGMEAASNLGISQSKSPYVVIHDDDDSWHPDFLAHCVRFLNSESGRRYGGVVTKSIYVSEEIIGDRVVEHRREPYQNWISTIYLAEMANGNFYPPIAFLYRREVYDNIGGYDETLPVLGDWDFNLRFLMQTDIGVIPEHLAYYHHRDVGNTAATYSNSVVGDNSLHREHNAIIRNKLVRLASIQQSPLPFLSALGYQTADVRARLDRLSKHSASRGTDISQSRGAPTSDSDDWWVLLQLMLRAVAPSPRLFSKFLVWKELRTLFEEEKPYSRESLRRLLSRSKIKLSPPKDFDETTYLLRNPDVADAVKNGGMPSGYHHYVLYGRYEGRHR